MGAESETWTDLLGRQALVTIRFPRGRSLPDSDSYYLPFDSAIWQDPESGKLYDVIVLDSHEPAAEFQGIVTALWFLREEQPWGAIRQASVNTPFLILSAPGDQLDRALIEHRLGFAPEDQHRILCLYENSSGAIPINRKGREPLYLLIESVKGHVGFPKGHLEINETDEEAALREVWEETGLQVNLLPGFRYQTQYEPVPGTRKTVTYFIGWTDSLELQLQTIEVLDAHWYSYEEALHKLSFENDREVLRRAADWLSSARLPFVNHD